MPNLNPRNLLSALLMFSLPIGLLAEGDLQGITAVSSKVASDYVHARTADGKLAPEYYAFGEGGKWPGEIADISIDRLKFLDVAHVVAPALEGRKYLPGTDVKANKLLIMLYWGTTKVPQSTSNSIAYSKMSDAQAALHQFTGTSVSGKQIVSAGPAADAAMDQLSAATALLNIENRQRETTDFQNAQMLGYDSPGLIGTEAGIYTKGTAREYERDQLYSEIEDNRYFVVLMAYDFQLLLKEKKHKLLWETRFSVTERNNQFDKALPAMANYASQYFGKPSGGLVREDVKAGDVQIGAAKVVEFIDEPKK